MADIISPDELTSYLRIPADTDVALIVELANGLVTETITDAGLTVPNPVPTKARAIALEAAGRAWRNPDGYSSETVDDYTYRRDAATRAAGVYLTDSEIEDLIGVAGRPRQRARSVKIGSPWDSP